MIRTIEEALAFKANYEKAAMIRYKEIQEYIQTTQLDEKQQALIKIINEYGKRRDEALTRRENVKPEVKD